jgi:hypothetical protein
VDDGLFLRVEDRDYFVGVVRRVEDVADIELLEIFVAVDVYSFFYGDAFFFIERE